MSTSTKRTKYDDQAGHSGAKVLQNLPSSLLAMLLLACDPKEIASQARHDDDLLLKLHTFSRSLDYELNKVSEERREEIALEAKTKEQSNLAKQVGCADCKAKEGNFKFCANFSRGRCYKDSSVLCAACFEKKKDSTTFCSRCQLLLCSECVQDKFGKCCGTDGFKCPNSFCSDCAHKEDYFQCYASVYDGNHMDECRNWFCADHRKDYKISRECYECNECEDVCAICYEDGGEYCSNCGLGLDL